MKRLKRFLPLLLILVLLVGCSVPTAKLSYDGSLVVSFLDCGQGDAALIVTPDRQAILVDAGEQDASCAVIQGLKDFGVTKLDLAVATHPHSDHIGGLPEVLSQVPATEILLPKSDHPTNTHLKLLETIRDKGISATAAKPGLTYAFGEVTLTTYAPVHTDYAEVNNLSVVFRLDYGATSFLFTGDAQSKAEKDILNEGASLSADVLKVGHHGSKTSTSKNFLQAASPSYAVISCGEGNSYGHPDEQILERLEEAGVEVHRTDLDGRVTFLSDGRQLQVITEK